MQRPSRPLVHSCLVSLLLIVGCAIAWCGCDGNDAGKNDAGKNSLGKTPANSQPAPGRTLASKGDVKPLETPVRPPIVPKITEGSEWTKAISPWLKTSPWWYTSPEEAAKARYSNRPLGPVFAVQSDDGPKIETVDRLWLWWQDLPRDLVRATMSTRVESNIHPEDYVGPESCKECHAEQYADWSQHPHRWMNTVASEKTVRGTFSGAKISYLGGTGTFYRENDEYRMRTERGKVRRVYRITQTLGSRFFQYYIGHQVSGPKPTLHPIDVVDHVLPFGFWIEENEWVPVVHISDEMPDGKRADPYDGADQDDSFFPYYTCNHCHTTFPLGDMFIRYARLLGRHTNMRLHWRASRYLESNRPDLLNGRPVNDFTDPDAMQLFARMEQMDARRYASSLGITCEACHLGGRSHAEGRMEKPIFLPASRHILYQPFGKLPSAGRSDDNVNWVCARCHTGSRPYYANGVSTWNSTEYTDAMRGGCYSELRCIDCHDPHTATGKKWRRTPAEDDASCLRCHSKTMDSPQAIAAHTHHAPGSEGSRCMNCHMPRLNEGLQDMVRTHTIFSPTDHEMIESNQPNACNMCHADRTIDWTLRYLSQWYDASYSEAKLKEAYPNRDLPVGVSWLKNPEPHVRIVGADSLTRTKAWWATESLLESLNDPFLVNRQFTTRGLEKMMGRKLLDYGYRFYMTPQERRLPIERLRQALSSGPKTPE